MLCEACQKNSANVHIVQIVNGKKVESNLCEACAAKINPTMFMGQENISLPNLLGSMFGNVFAVPQMPQFFSGEVPACPNCGTKFTDIGKSGRLGCSSCYQAFLEELQPSLKRIQGDVEHVGKIPLRNGEQAAQKKKLAALKQQLQEAIAAEKYELAAEVRDEIKELEKSIGGRGGAA